MKETWKYCVFQEVKIMALWYKNRTKSTVIEWNEGQGNRLFKQDLDWASL